MEQSSLGSMLSTAQIACLPIVERLLVSGPMASATRIWICLFGKLWLVGWKACQRIANPASSRTSIKAIESKGTH